ncbi:MAG: hypothetical protein Q9201_000409 [Fulgogasparrea decipioides]
MAFLTLLLSACHVLFNSYLNVTHKPSDKPIYDLFGYQSSVEFITAYNVTTKSVALSFGHQHFSPDFSAFHLPPTKRVLEPDAALCKGQKLYQRMKDSYAEYNRDNRRKGREFGEDDIKNGWTTTLLEFPELEERWDGPFRDTITTNGQTAEHLNRQYITMQQDRIFRTDKGSYSNSPTNQLNEKYKGALTSNDISASVPPLNRLSDTIWTVWKTVTRTEAEARKIRYLGRDNVINPDTVHVMKRIFEVVRGRTHVPWPGLSYGMNDDIGLTLLGTPNGLAAVWLLIDHHSIWAKGSRRSLSGPTMGRVNRRTMKKIPLTSIT